MRSFCLVVICGVGGALAGCGQKGPLVLPDLHSRSPVNGQSSAVPAAPASAAPQAPKSGASSGSPQA
ncbi:MAG TPA: lipoprotein [Steroidobacteraceae bacterium]|nr:lipoprotein [Steroidobacteraceae bacterium]